jgi:hypothetical protein
MAQVVGAIATSHVPLIGKPSRGACRKRPAGRTSSQAMRPFMSGSAKCVRTWRSSSITIMV